MINEFVTQLRKVGNSVIITVPKPVLDKYKLKEKDFVSCIISKAEDNPLLYRLLEGNQKKSIGIINEFVSNLRKVGNSVIITVPKPVLDKYKLKEKDFVSCIISKAEDNPLLYKILNNRKEVENV